MKQLINFAVKLMEKEKIYLGDQKRYLEDFSNENTNEDKLALAIKEQIEVERK